MLAVAFGSEFLPKGYGRETYQEWASLKYCKWGVARPPALKEMGMDKELWPLGILLPLMYFLIYFSESLDEESFWASLKNIFSDDYD